MKSFYPLKKSKPTNLLEPLKKYLQQNESPEVSLAFHDALSKITDLRTKATTLQLPQNHDPKTLDKYIAITEMYTRFALLIAKHFNWNPNNGQTVQNLNITWTDSFNPQLSFTKNQIHYDIFCCFYNLGLLHFNKATKLSMEDLLASRKESIASGKSAYYFFNTMRTFYYQGFVNTGFSDTNYSHLEMLESICLGIVYKNMFNIFKEDQYIIGIQKLASVAGMASENFFKGYQIGTTFFMKSPNISSQIKSQILSFSYVESLIHDTLSNAKYAKYFENEMEFNKDNITFVIAYQRKALRLLNLGLTNQSVISLLDQRKQQKNDLLKIKPQLQINLKNSILRNQQIYERPEISQEKIPAPPEPPKEYVVKIVEPAEIQVNYEGSIAGLFLKLVDNESKVFMNELKDFSKNRILGLEAAYQKLLKNVQVIYNDSYVNYYINLENNTEQKGIPQILKRKIENIKANGGKTKIDNQIGIIKSNSQKIGNRFKELRQIIADEESLDNGKRQQYGNKWNRPPSNIVNKSYLNQLDIYESKGKSAQATNMQIVEKYVNLQKYIAVIDGSQQQLMNVIPKIELSKFLEENKADFQSLKAGDAAVKQKISGLQSLSSEIKEFLDKIDYNGMANKHYRIAEKNKQAILDKIFGNVYKMIETFNNKAENLEDNAQKVGQISLNLNKRNKSDDTAKKEFEIVMSIFTDISTMYRQLSQGTAFYTKLNDILSKIWLDLQIFIVSRKFEAKQLQSSIKKGGNQGGPNLPNMYPNQKPQNQNAGFYVPQPVEHNGASIVNPSKDIQQEGGKTNVGDMLKNLMSSKPNFDDFGGNVYKSKYK